LLIASRNGWHAGREREKAKKCTSGGLRAGEREWESKELKEGKGVQVERVEVGGRSNAGQKPDNASGRINRAVKEGL
jgi:hypothetical protein